MLPWSSPGGASSDTRQPTRARTVPACELQNWKGGRGLRAHLPTLGRSLRELSGALGDSGVLAPIALALIAVNGLHPSPLFFVFGIAYAAAGFYYRLPVPVQPRN